MQQRDIMIKETLYINMTFTAVAATDVVTLAAGRDLPDGFGPFRVSTSGVLPAGLAAATDYWWIRTGPGTGKISATAKGAVSPILAPIDITDAGSGTHTLTPTVYYIPLPLGGDVISAVHIGWHDATSNAAIVLETTCLSKADAEDYANDAWKWAAPAGVVITGPSATAIGAFALDLGNHGASRYRLKVTVTASPTFSIAIAGKR